MLCTLQRSNDVDNTWLGKQLRESLKIQYFLIGKMALFVDLLLFFHRT